MLAVSVDIGEGELPPMCGPRTEVMWHLGSQLSKMSLMGWVTSAWSHRSLPSSETHGCQARFGTLSDGRKADYALVLTGESHFLLVAVIVDLV